MSVEMMLLYALSVAAGVVIGWILSEVMEDRDDEWD